MFNNPNIKSGSNSFHGVGTPRFTDFLINSGVEIEVLTSKDVFNIVEDEWNEIVDLSDATIYQTFEWNSSWWRHFGDGSQLFVFTIRKEKQLVGIIPLFIDNIYISSWAIYTCLRFLGSTVSQPLGEELKGLIPYSDYLDMIIRPGYEQIVCEIFADFMLRTMLPYHEIILDEVSKRSNIYRFLLPFLANLGIEVAIQKGSTCTGIKLEACWDGYLDTLSKRSRYNARKYLKLANNDEKKVFDIQRIKDVDEMAKPYEKLVGLHQKRWNGNGYPGAFAERRFYNFLKEITARFMQQGWAEIRLARSINEQNRWVALDLLFKFKDRIYLNQRAIDVDSEMIEYGPGNVMLYQEIKDAIQEDYTLVDFLRGDESYKFRTVNEVRENTKIVIPSIKKYRKINSALAKRMVTVKRRAHLGLDELKVFVNGDNWSRGIYDYAMFLYDKIRFQNS